MERTRPGQWSRQQSAEYYLVNRWGAPYFGINDSGNLAFSAPGRAGSIDLRALVDDLRRRGIAAPILLRFNDILAGRVSHLHDCFARAIAARGYRGSYRGVLPIKVNQQRHVVEELVRAGAAAQLGLEAGSKPELLAAIAMLADSPGAWLVCNGYKDRAYIETALHAQWLGLVPYIVLERYEELALVVQAARDCGIRPHIGMRAKLAARGAGRWKDSSGDRSKFGLSAKEMVAAVQALREAGLLDCLELLHFHIGSQISSIHCIKDALREAMQVYVGLRAQGASSLQVVDCGGGLAVDYDGSRTDFHASMNYSTQEYASDVVAVLGEVCDRYGQPHPTIVTESGRALVAQHSVLVFDVLGVRSFAEAAAAPAPKPAPASAAAAPAHPLLQRMAAVLQGIDGATCQRAYNDIVTLKEETESSFRLGLIDLTVRAAAEDLYWRCCQQVRAALADLSYVPEDLRDLVRQLSDTYYCNFSVFQSLPDSWAVQHLFPIAPLQRHDEAPRRDAILADLTCDSDGKVDKFIDLRDVRQTLRLHEPNGEPYYLGAFLVGAYQEILGDLHNLFGHTNAVHVALADDGGYRLEHVVEGDSVADVLAYVEYDRGELMRRVRRAAERAVRAQGVAPEQFASFIKRYEEGLAGYTYLEDIV